MESREDYAIARKYMEFTDTLRFEKKPVNTMSGGERQKVLFAKALAQETDILLLDEPSASLDISHEEQIFRQSAELCSKGKTVVAAVHDLKVAARFCSRLVLMKAGTILADGRAEEVLTSENLSSAYGINALVYRNKITGQVDYHIHGVQEGHSRKHMHVIGGGGSASGVIRWLFESGHRVSAGVFSHGDSDLQCADVYGIKRIVCKPFSEIDANALAENIELINNAEVTILCNMPFGAQNLRNLEAAKHARSLVIIEDESPEARDFTGGQALKLYNELKRTAMTTTSATLHEVL